MDAETIAVALLSSVVGGAGGALLATMLRIGHERQERLRERMLTAADDFAIGVQQAGMALREARSHEGDVHPAGTVLPTTAEARRCVGEVEARLARIRLLFGEFTAACDAAERVDEGLEVQIEALQPRWLTPTEEQLEQAMEDTWEGLRAFNREALRALRRPGYGRSRWRWEHAKAKARREALAELRADDPELAERLSKAAE